MKKTELEKTTSREEDTSQLIGNLNSHCDDCSLIDWCGEPYTEPYLCSDRRFENIHVSKYISFAESSIVKIGELADIDLSEVNRNDYDCVSDYEDELDRILLNTYKALVADDVEKSLNVIYGLETTTAAVQK